MDLLVEGNSKADANTSKVGSAYVADRMAVTFEVTWVTHSYAKCRYHASVVAEVAFAPATSLLV
jgi:hypothetical protein